MESRKNQLKKQIIEALKANNKDLYSLLRSQWAHRFGVESLEELKGLDFNEVNGNPKKENKLKIGQTQDYTSDDANAIAIKDDNNQEKEIKNENKKIIESVNVEEKEFIESKSYKIIDKEDYENKSINPVINYKTNPKVEKLIPLPPKPKYSYLNKWLLRSKL